MSKSHNTVVQDPRTPANLQNLSKVDIRCDMASGTFLGLKPVKLKRTVHEMLVDEGLAVEKNSKSLLILGIAVEPRDAGRQVIYAVEVVLREPAALPRIKNRMQMAEVDTWRHQTITGVLFAPYDSARLAQGLIGEAIRQVGIFLEDWAAGNNAPPPTTVVTNPGAPPTPSIPFGEDWFHKTEMVRERLKLLLQKLTLGPSSSATLDKFEVQGTKVDFAGTIRNVLFDMQSQNWPSSVTLSEKTTQVAGSFDLADPDSVKNQTLVAELPPELNRPNPEISLDELAELLQ